MLRGDHSSSDAPARRNAAAALVGLVLLGGCATRVATYTPPPAAGLAELARPARVLVVPFAIDADAIQEDQALGPRLQRGVAGDAAQRRSALAGDVQLAIDDTLLSGLAKIGLPVKLASADMQPGPGDLLVTGTVLRVDEGNRTRRLAVGFGAGKSTVTATADLSAVRSDGSRILLQRYNGSSNSGHKPGLAAGGLGAAAQASAVTGALSAAASVGGEVRRAPVTAEAGRTAERLASDIGRYVADCGWAPSAASASR